MVVANPIRGGIGNHDVADVLRQLEGKTDLHIFLFVAFADDFNDGPWH